MVRPGDTAVEGKDYLLYTHASPGCSLEGDHTPGGCVQFSPSQTSISLSVVILPDTILEGDEVFHLRIVYVREGRKSPEFYRSTLTFTILDATKRELTSGLEATYQLIPAVLPLGVESYVVIPCADRDHVINPADSDHVINPCTNRDHQPFERDHMINP